MCATHWSAPQPPPPQPPQPNNHHNPETTTTTTTQHNNNNNNHTTTQQQHTATHSNTTTQQQHNNHNNKNTIWRGSVLAGEEFPPNSGKLKHASLLCKRLNPIPAIPQYVVKTPHLHELRLRRKHLLLNPNTNAANGICLEKNSKKS